MTSRSERNWQNWLALAFLGAGLTAGAFTIAGCNTVEGAGEDVEDLGEGVQDVADDAED